MRPDALTAAVVRPSAVGGSCQRSEKARLLPGTAAVALALAAGRWGGYLGMPQHDIYLTDVLIAAAAIRVVLRPRPAGDKPWRRSAVGALLLSYAVYSVLRLLTSPAFTTAALRDFAPYAYSAVGLLVLNVAGEATAADRARTLRVLRWALLVHLAWVAFSLLRPSLSASLPAVSLSPEVHILDIRSDFDGSMVALLCLMALGAALTNRLASLRNFALSAVSGAVVLELHSRASLIALLVGLPITVLLSAKVSRRSRTISIVLVPLLLVVGTAVLPLTTAGQRLLLEVPASQDAQAGAEAAGTTRAREAAWIRVTQYSLESESRAVFGVGFGPDFMTDSGALYLLVGSDSAQEVRSPHNYLIGTLARLGVVGVLIFLALLIALGCAIWRQPGRRDALGVAAIMLLVVIVIPAFLGVVLESPFGAVPFFWAAGVVAGNRPKGG